MIDCPTCGLPCNDNDKECKACGSKLPVKIKQIFCPVCGNTLFESTTRCRICGTAVKKGEDTSAKEELQKKKEALKNPTMDELFVPEITDEMLGIIKTTKPIDPETAPTMDSVATAEDRKRAKAEAIGHPELAEENEKKSGGDHAPLPLPTVITAEQVKEESEKAEKLKAESIDLGKKDESASGETVITPEGERKPAEESEEAKEELTEEQKKERDQNREIDLKKALPIVIAVAVLILVIIVIATI